MRNFWIGRRSVEIERPLLLSSYGSGPKMNKFTTVYVLSYRSSYNSHFLSDFAQIWYEFTLGAYLGISVKTFV